MQPKKNIKSLQIIHAVLCFGLLFFSGFVYAQSEGFNKNIATNDIFIYIVPSIAMAGYFGSKFVFQTLVQKIQKSDSSATKLGRYQVASIVKYALIEAPSFLSLFAYLTNGNPLFLAIAFCLMAYLFFQRPTLHKLENDINLSSEELHQFK